MKKLKIYNRSDFKVKRISKEGYQFADLKAKQQREFSALMKKYKNKIIIHPNSDRTGIILYA